MLLLSPTDPRVKDETPTTVALFGRGLIGEAVERAMNSRLPRKREHWPFSWGSPAQQDEQLAQIGERLALLGGGDGHSQTRPRLAVLWSAGRGGFCASEAEVQPEFTSFRRVVDWACDLAAHNVMNDMSFHMLSSAGGLFEGQTGVGMDTEPVPRRPYGRLKLSQERYLELFSGVLSVQIYRPSSVYGRAGAGARMGLIASLIKNTLERRTTRIIGNMSTLRDYVFNDDIGRFIARNLDNPKPEPGCSTSMLASGIPTSIHSIVKLVESATRNRAYLHFLDATLNSLNNSYLPSALPQNFHPTDLETSIRGMVRDFRA